MTGDKPEAILGAQHVSKGARRTDGGLPADDEPDGDIYLPHHFWLGVVIMLGGWFYWGQDPVGGWVALIGLLVVADDLIEHFFGLPTPLDALFKKAMTYPRFRRAWIRLLNTYR